MPFYRKYLFPLLLSLLFTAGCTLESSDPDLDTLEVDVPPVTSGEWYRPAPLTTWQWQLAGEVNLSYDAEIYDIDLFDSSESLIRTLHASGRKVVCYFSAGSFEAWREDASIFEEAEIGKPLDGWPGERWLDIRSSNVHAIIKRRLDLAKRKGCDGVEPDNVDGYLNDTGFGLGYEDQLAFNRFVANEAHKRGLSVGLKNDLEQVGDLVDYFDFALNEECFEFFECDALLPFIESKKAVLNAEYAKKFAESEDERSALCSESLQLRFSTLILNTDLDDRIRYSCL